MYTARLREARPAHLHMLNTTNSGPSATGIAPPLFPDACEGGSFESAQPETPQLPPGEADREALILGHLREVKQIARSIYRRVPSTVQLDDLVQAGMLGLIDAATRYDHSRPLLFPQYARIRITGAIYDSLRDLDWASRYMRTRQQKLENTAAHLARILGRQPSSDEVADALGMDLDTFYEFASAVQDVQRVELDAHPNDAQHSVYEQLPANPERGPDVLLFEKETRECVRKEINELPPDERTVMFLYYLCDWRMEAIARRIHRTESRVSQIHSRAVARLRQRLTSRLRGPSHRSFQRVSGNPLGVQ